MTVCVATLCADGSAAVGASDRMVSTADNQTKRLKIHHLTDHVIAMIAGDVALHTELLIEVRRLIADTSSEPASHSVKNIADAYSLAYLEGKKRRAERQFLLPLGLDSTSFIANQRSLDEKIAADITRELLHYRMPPCAAILMGIDNSLGYWRAHLYTMDEGSVSCHNDTGIASIGVGMYQAMASLMFGGHTAQINFDAAVYMTLAAKKRAEVAPGVGQETDMAVVTLADNGHVILKSQVVDTLEEIYEKADRTHTSVNDLATQECHDYLQTFRTPDAQPEPEERVELSGTPPTTDPAGLPSVGADGAGAPKASSVQHDAGPGREEEGRRV